MSIRKKIWSSLRDTLLSPKVDEQRLEDCLKQVRDKLAVPVFWLFGKTQTGKTSIIRALTDSTRAEIGNGFRPCTRTAQMYAFPNEDECLLKFLDTRGLGEVAYDPTDDLQVLADQSHLLIVVMRALDHAQQCVMEPLRQIVKTHPHWPLIVVQTSLHDGYGNAIAPGQHPQPYPFAKFPFPPEVPSDLARSLAAQRELFQGLNARFVPLDFTLLEDGFDDANYGIDALWQAIDDTLPLGLRGMLREAQDARDPLRDVFFRTAHPHILSYAVAAGAAAAVPVPVVDIPLVLSIQAKMFHTLASIYQQPMNARRMAEIGSTLGVGFLVRLGGRELLKAIPGLGSVVAGLYAAASTYALGRTLAVYFSRIQHGDVPDPQLLRKIYLEQFAAGQQRLGPYLKSMLRSNAD